MPISFHVGKAAVPLLSVLLFPGSQMRLVNSHRGFQGIRCGPFGKPGGIAPLKVRYIACHRSRAGAVFRRKCIRIRFEQDLPAGGCDGKFVELSIGKAGHKCLINPAVLRLSHRIQIRVPSIEITDYADRRCMGRPHGKIIACLTVVCKRMRAQLLINPVVASLAVQVAVQFTQHAVAAHSGRF